MRIETGVREKDTISTFYDPMTAKLITYGKDRNEAIELMKRALAEYRVSMLLVIGGGSANKFEIPQKSNRRECI